MISSWIEGGEDQNFGGFRWVRQFRSTLSTLKFGLGYLDPALKTKLSMICPKKEILVSVAFLGKELVERAGRH